MLRDYQERAVAACLAHLAAGRHTCLTLPTGGGKTRCAVAIAQRIGLPYAVLTNRRELQRQGRAAGLENVLSWQQLALTPEQHPDVRLLIVDECHFAATAGPMQAALDCFPNAVRLGLTATPSRSDGVPLGALFSELVVGASYSELLRAGHLVPVRVFRPSEELDGLAKPPVGEYLLRTPGRSAVVFAAGTEDGLATTQSFRDAGINAAFVGQGTSTAERDAHIADLAAGRLTVLVNVFVLTAGWDCPSCEVCILARSFESTATYLQAVGRVMRPAPGKTDAVVLDLRGVSWRHGAPTQDREYSLSGKPIRATADSLRVCPACGWCFEPGPARCPSCNYKPTAEEVRRQTVHNVETHEAVELLPANPDELDRLLKLARDRGYGEFWAVTTFRKKFAKPEAWDAMLYGQVYGSLRKKGKSRTQAHAMARKALL